MRLSTLSIHRPVFAVVMTLLLVLFGILSYLRLDVREYPDIKPPVVSVRTVYPGAGASVIETNVTTTLEDVLSGVQGLRSITSNSREEVSSVTLEFDIDRDLDSATNDVRDRISSVRSLLPLGIQEPIVSKAASDGTEVVWLAVASNRHSELEITDITDRFIKPRLVIIPGVSNVFMDGERRYAMRIWLDPRMLAARRLTVQDVEEALRAQNASIPSGRIESDRMEFGVSLKGTLQTESQFGDLIVAYRDGYPVRIRDVARVELAAEDTRKLSRINGKPCVGVAVMKQSKANALTVARAVKERLPEITAMLPEGIALTVAWDSTVSIEHSLYEMYIALGISLMLVTLVIFGFLGNVQATLVPAVAIPASIIGTFTVMALTGCSLNVLTLLALVLAVGLVVDDAIIVLENIHRRMGEGMPGIQAAVEGTKEISFAVIATTISLVTVFIPIALLTGIVGRLFAELAIAVASAVLLSGFVALTLTPMMAGRLAQATGAPSTRTLGERVWGRVMGVYRQGLVRVMGMHVAILVIGVGASLGSLLIMLRLPSELAPMEDVGWFAGHLAAPQGATIRYTDTYAQQLDAMIKKIPEVDTVYTIVGRGERPTIVNRAGSWVTLKDWGERSRSQQELVSELNVLMPQLAGVKAFLMNPPPINGGSEKASFQFVIGGVDFQELERTAKIFLGKLSEHPGFVAPEIDLMLDKPHLTVEAHRAKAADLGVSVTIIGRTLETLLSGRAVSTFSRNGRQYNVIVKVDDRHREKPSDISDLYVRGNGEEFVQLSNVVSVKEESAPESLNHVDRMRAVMLSAGLADGFTMGDALIYIEREARSLVNAGMRVTYAGEAKEYAESNRNMYFTFGLALAVIYLVLSAQFESFRDPLTILLTVPPAVTGGLLALVLTKGTLSIFSQIGLVILIGLVSKNAILIVEFANQLRERGRGMDRVDAVIEAATLRLRPILMTTSATILGALPLALAAGAGAASRRQIGVVLIGGLVVSTIVTLFLVPAGYAVVSGKRRVWIGEEAERRESAGTSLLPSRSS